MFRPVPLLRLSAVVLERDERAVLRLMGGMGALHLIRTPAGPDTAPLGPPDHSVRLARCDRFLARLTELRRSLSLPIPPETTDESLDMDLDGAEVRLEKWMKQADGLLKRRQQLLKRQGELDAVWEQAWGFRRLEIPLDRLSNSAFLHFVIGDLPAQNLARLKKSVGDNVVLLPLPEQKGRRPLVAMTSRRAQAALDSALQEAGFESAALPQRVGMTPAMWVNENHLENEQTEKELKRINGAIEALAAEVVRPLAQMEQLAEVERELLEAEGHFPRTQAAVLLQGWIPAAEVPVLTQRLRHSIGGRCAIETTAPGDVPEDEIPVLLRHPWLLRPFAPLVAAYGLPKYRELEPTLFVAISYVFMFGMMFGDVGHGAVLALGGLSALLWGRAVKTRELGMLFLSVGLSSILFGILYGSYFGLPALKKYALWHDPLEGSPIGLMSAGIGVGVAMISLGLILNIINRFRRGDRLGGLLDKFGAAGLLFYWGTLALLMKQAAFRAQGLTRWAILLFIVLPVTGWALQGPIRHILNRRAGHPSGPDGLLAASVESLVDAFEGLIVYLANTISFVRLAAYAMSHAALLMATFMMAAEVERLCGGSSLPGALVIILGNGAAILLEGTIAAVQTLRLEYYEFFGKFFSGDGHPFKPFSLT